MATEDIYSELDRLSNLPESFLISNILSRLPVVDAVRSSLLARKWRYLWTKIPHLNFSADFFRKAHSYRLNQNTMEHVLIQHDAPIESFRLHLPNSIGGYRMDLDQCIHYAVKKGVKWMALKANSAYWTIDLPVSLFTCTTLVGLKLTGLMIPEIPLPSEHFSSLNTCCLCEIGYLTIQGLQRLVELCPLLQELVLLKCGRLRHLEIETPSLNCLILESCNDLQSLTADCPQLLQLTTRNCSNLAELEINSYSFVELELRDFYDLSRLQINSCLFLKEAGSLEGLSLEGHSIVESLRKLWLKRRSSTLPDSDLHCSTLFGTFPDLEQLRVSSCNLGIAGVRGHEQASREMELVSDFAFPNLKNIYVDISSDAIEKELAILGFLLRNAPSLKTMTVALPYCFEDNDDQEFKNHTVALPYCVEDIDRREFKNHLLGLKRASADVEIKILENDDDEEYNEKYEDPGKGWGYAHENESLESESAGWESENEELEMDEYNWVLI